MKTRSSLHWLPAFLFLSFFPPRASAGLVVVQLERTGSLAISGLVDTTADTFRIDSWSTLAGSTYRTPLSSQLPLILSAFTLTGDRFDVPDSWTGAIGASAGWAFLLPVGQDVTTIQWIEGQPSNFWRTASFGWGGLRNRLGNVVLRSGNNAFAYVPNVSDAMSEVALDRVTLRPVPEPSSALFGVALSLLCLGRATPAHRRPKKYRTTP